MKLQVIIAIVIFACLAGCGKSEDPKQSLGCSNSCDCLFEYINEVGRLIPRSSKSSLLPSERAELKTKYAPGLQTASVESRLVVDQYIGMLSAAYEEKSPLFLESAEKHLQKLMDACPEASKRFVPPASLLEEICQCRKLEEYLEKKIVICKHSVDSDRQRRLSDLDIEYSSLLSNLARELKAQLGDLDRVLRATNSAVKIVNRTGGDLDSLTLKSAFLDLERVSRTLVELCKNQGGIIRTGRKTK